jgi:putative membrane protein
MPSMAIPLALVGGVTLAYGILALGERRTRRGWSNWRTASFFSGAAVLALGLLPDWLPYPAGDFRKHMLEHLAIGMIAPIGLVMGAPVTLLLRSIPPRAGRVVMRFLRSRVMGMLSTPAVALVLDMGGMAALYFTPLYREMMVHPALHYLVHVHFLAAGCLYSWVIAGPDPAPHRPSVEMRLVVLGVAIVIHSVLAQLLYAGAGVNVFAAEPTAIAAGPMGAMQMGDDAAPRDLQLQRGAELMYYGGDISEMLLAFALVTTWRPAGRHIANTIGSRKPAREPAGTVNAETTV